MEPDLFDEVLGILDPELADYLCEDYESSLFRNAFPQKIRLVPLWETLLDMGKIKET